MNENKKKHLKIVVKYNLIVPDLEAPINHEDKIPNLMLFYLRIEEESKDGTPISWAVYAMKLFFRLAQTR
jgi:hypothetical protein